MEDVANLSTSSILIGILGLVTGISVEDEFRVGTRRGRYAIPRMSRQALARLQRKESDFCKLNKSEEELCSLKGMWYFCLKHMDRLTETPAALQAAVFKRLFDITEVESMPAEDNINHIKSMTTERDIHNQIAYARKEGKAEGIAEGIAQGKTEGESAKQAEIARNMLADGLNAKKIAVYTGQTEEQIKAL